MRLAERGNTFPQNLHEYLSLADLFGDACDDDSVEYWLGEVYWYGDTGDFPTGLNEGGCNGLTGSLFMTRLNGLTPTEY